VSRIPVIGGLFGDQSLTKNRTELVMFITPRVVETEADLKGTIEDLRRRMQQIDDTFDVFRRAKAPDAYSDAPGATAPAPPATVVVPAPAAPAPPPAAVFGPTTAAPTAPPPAAPPPAVPGVPPMTRP
jgi:general secretion pathway protein D